MNNPNVKKVIKSIKKLHPDWLEFFNDNKKELVDILNIIYETEDQLVFPNTKDIFRIFKYISPTEIKVVLLGQDPYINSEIIDNVKIPQAEGFSFSVPENHKKIPPSLKNIYKEIKNSYPEFVFTNGNLTHWVKNEKIFLLNSSLTVIEGLSNSHQKLWSNFTNKVIKYINDINNNTIFLLMGGNAISKSKLIDNNKHSILTCVHPSPLSAHRGFLGSKIFEKVNEQLISQGKSGIVW